MKRNGFTLVELLGVIIILSLLILLVFPSITNSVKTSSTKTDELTLKMIYDASKLYVSNHEGEFSKRDGNKFIITLDELIDEGHLSSPIKLSNNDDITNEKCVQVTYNQGFSYELKDSGTCEEKTIGLPTQYQQVEYIESSGTQYIDTNYYLKSNSIEIKTKIYTKSMPSNEQDIIGNQDDLTSRFVVGLYSNAVFAYSRDTNGTDNNVVTNTYSGEQTLEITSKYDYSNKIKNLTVNGSTYTQTQNYTIYSANSTNTVKIFNDGDNNYNFVGRMYYLKLYDENKLVRDFIPCYRKSTKDVGMYDLVEGKFYINTGSGTFTKGSNV